MFGRDSNQNNIGNKLKEISKNNSKKESWIKTRMWFSTFMSTIYPDMTYIPDNIGNNVYIGNNQYVTKNSISAVILIREFSEETPIAFTSMLTKEIKSKLDGVEVDFTFKNNRYKVDLNDSGLKSRIRQWVSTLDNENAAERTKNRAARLLYTVDIAKSNEAMFKSHCYIIIRAKSGSTLKTALSITKSFLNEYNCFFKIVKTDLKDHLEYLSLMSDKRQGKLKDIPYTIQSAMTISEMLPTTQGLNDPTGNYMGMNRKNRSPYFINFRRSSAGKNIYIVAPTGKGKTFLVINWLVDGYAIGYNLCLMDLKGNDYDTLTAACGGTTLSMRSDSTEFVNTFTMSKEEGKDNPTVYFSDRFKLSKMTLMIIADLSPELESRGESLIDKFLHSIYTSAGVLAENPNTWYKTESFHPYQIFEKFEKFLSPEIISTYNDVAEKILMRLKIYMSRNGSNSHMFRDSYNIEDILDKKVIRFDFGMLESGRTKDPVTFKLKVLFMKLINDEYSRHKKSLSEWTIKVLEESQVAEEFLLKIYVEELTLRRAQNQVTVLVGNSVSALKDNPIAKPLLDNLNILVIGSVPKSSREFLIEEYGLEGHEHSMMNIVNNPDYANTFLLVNRMQANSTTALIKAFVPDKVVQGKIFKNVDVIEEMD